MQPPDPDGLNAVLPVLTWAANPKNPTPEDYAKAAAAPIPARGINPTPAWFEWRLDGWRCSYPHPDPAALKAINRIPNPTNHGLGHLDAHHPGWKVRCSECGQPQWNELESPHCYDCRRRADH